jgi:creatinine amidohydrolase/Fe(II)-dependent formamide hydrolase-like protein
VVAPTVWMGLAEHHVAYGGTFSISIATYHALLRDLCDAILRAGFKQILIVNSHGGNSAALTALTTDFPASSRRRLGLRQSTLSRTSMGHSHRSSRIRRVSATPAKQKPR